MLPAELVVPGSIGQPLQAPSYGYPQREQSSREFWLAHVKAWRASGLKKHEYCDHSFQTSAASGNSLSSARASRQLG